MKKKIAALLLGMAMCLSVTACGGGNDKSDKTEDTAKTEQSEDSASDAEDSEETKEDAASDDKDKSEDPEQAGDAGEQETPEEPEEEEKIYNIGETATLKDWDISVTDVQIVESIAADYGSFSPDEEGNRYVQVFATITNNGKQAGSFLPMIGMGDDVSVKVLFGDGYEFASVNLLGYSNDLHDSKVNPLSSQTGEIAFDVPETVASSEEELLIQFNSGNDSVKFKLR